MGVARLGLADMADDSPHRGRQHGGDFVDVRTAWNGGLRTLADKLAAGETDAHANGYGGFWAPILGAEGVDREGNPFQTVEGYELRGPGRRYRHVATIRLAFESAGLKLVDGADRDY